MQDELYPLKFSPILKSKIWGGQKLKTLLNKDSDLPNIGESWEISDVDDDTSIVVNGALSGKSLSELIADHKDALVGVKNYKRFGNKFPLLIKFIDAKEALSIQLHPNDKLAAERHNSFGKTEMWYIMDADEDANLIIGFNEKMSSQEYLKHLEAKTLPEILNFEDVKEGDTFFIEVGRVHAIGAGVMLAEIQQTSDVTYRVYDWDRTDEDGNERELHNELAIDAIDFNMKNDFKIAYNSELNQSNSMVKCQYFTTNFLHINSRIEKENIKDSFVIYMCVDGAAEITIGNNFSESLVKGETLLMPATLKSYSIESNYAKLLEVYV